MTKLKYLLPIVLFFSSFHTVVAFDIQYGTILGTSGSTFLVQYYNIDEKQNFLCKTTTHSCAKTKKTTLGTVKTTALKKSVQQELRNVGANHITLSPSGTYLAYFNAGDYTRPTRTYTLRNLKTNAESKISNSVSYWDLIDDEAKVFTFSPDSKKLIYLDDADGTQTLYSADVHTTNQILSSKKLHVSAYQVDDFIFTDSSTLYYIGNTKTNPYAWSLYRYNMKTNTDTVIASNVSYVDPIRYIGKAIVFNQLQAQGYGPAQYNVSTKKVQQFSIPHIDTKTGTKQIVVNTPNTQGIIMAPEKIDASKPYPLLIWLHGGPYRQTSLGYHPYHSYGIYDGILKLLQKDNVVILKLDYPGSFGSGRSYAESIQGSVGKTDVDNVMTAISYMKSKYNIDNVYLAGNSYGGYLSLKSVVEHPNAFAGVVSINGVTDWQVLLEKLKTSIFNTHFNGLPNPSNQYLYNQASIVAKTANLTNQKIQIIQGQSDRTIDPSQAELIYNDLVLKGKNASIVRYDGEDHVFQGKKAITDLCGQMYTFLGKTISPECKS